MQVNIASHDETWAEAGNAAALEFAAATGAELHHIGSTSVPGLAAKPTLDLLPLFSDLASMEAGQSAIRALVYDWLGPFGLPRRRYCRRMSRVGQLRVNAHCYVVGDIEAVRHIAYRDHLRIHPDRAAAYEIVKRTCAAQHALDGAAYGQCKSAWIDTEEAVALAAYLSSR